MLADRLSKAWRSRRESTAIDPMMRFSEEGLVLGAGTVVAPSTGSSRNILLDHLEPRLHALLAAAHLRRPTLGALIHLRKAADRWCEGQDTLAAMHLALSGLERLKQPEADAHRLFLVDGLLKSGIEAGAIVDAIEAGASAVERLHKFNQDQPRVPAGRGRTSGEWTASGDSSGDGGRPEAEVNPGTTTEVGATEADQDVCEEAKMDCYRAVIEESLGEHANDNLNQEDALNCRMAGWACTYVRAAIKYTPLLDRGGVIFPHRGVVIFQKGRSDVYLPPIAPGVAPRFRRSL
jgi:hypothetical protein